MTVANAICAVFAIIGAAMTMGLMQAYRDGEIIDGPIPMYVFGFFTLLATYGVFAR